MPTFEINTVGLDKHVEENLRKEIKELKEFKMKIIETINYDEHCDYVEGEDVPNDSLIDAIKDMESEWDPNMMEELKEENEELKDKIKWCISDEMRKDTSAETIEEFEKDVRENWSELNELNQLTEESAIDYVYNHTDKYDDWIQSSTSFLKLKEENKDLKEKNETSWQEGYNEGELENSVDTEYLEEKDEEIKKLKKNMSRFQDEMLTMAEELRELEEEDPSDDFEKGYETCKNDQHEIYDEIKKLKEELIITNRYWENKEKGEEDA